MEEIHKQPLENLVIQYIEMKSSIEDIQAGQSVIRDEILDRLKEMKISGTSVSGYSVSRYTRHVFGDVKESTARSLGAIKQTIDSTKLKNLIKKGVKVDGSKAIICLSIRQENK